MTGRTVVLRTTDGEEINVPNSTVVNEAVVNLTKLGRRRSTVSVGVAYGSDLDEARRIVVEAARSSSLILADPAPDSVVTEFGDHAINIDVRFWHEPTVLGGRKTIDEVARRIATELSGAGIEIAFPQRTLRWGEGQEPAGGNLES